MVRAIWYRQQTNSDELTGFQRLLDFDSIRSYLPNRRYHPIHYRSFSGVFVYPLSSHQNCNESSATSYSWHHADHEIHLHLQTEEPVSCAWWLLELLHQTLGFRLRFNLKFHYILCQWKKALDVLHLCRHGHDFQYELFATNLWSDGSFSLLVHIVIEARIWHYKATLKQKEPKTLICSKQNNNSL